MFDQHYDQQTYLKYEEEARMCAGLILCPPQYYYNFPHKMSVDLFQQRYKVSGSCAQTRIDILNKYEQEIKNNDFYNVLPKIRYSTRQEYPWPWGIYRNQSSKYVAI